MGKKIRIANGQGFWGDWLEAPVQLVERGPIDYLTLDYLAEITMSILQKQRSRDPRIGYATDFVTTVERVLPRCIERNIRIVANAGGVNPDACRDAIALVVNKLGLQGKVKIGVVSGDDLMASLDNLISSGVALKNMETGEDLATIRKHVQSANVYFGAAPIAEALNRGANIVITGRSTDTGLALAPMIHEFGWSLSDWNKIAAGTIAGHIIECGAQTTGGNCQVDWRSIPNMADIGYPIIEAEDDGSFVVTKHDGTGGRVDVAGIKEQLLYEMGDPTTYITPDCIADFTSIQLAQEGENRVRVSEIKGRAPTDSFKVSISYEAGFKAIGMLIYSWPDAVAKAQAADQVLRQRLKNIGLAFDAVETQFVGADSLHGRLAGQPNADIPEVVLRVGVRSASRSAVDRFTKEIAPLALNGPPTVSGLGSGRPKVEEIIAYWPALIPKSVVEPVVEVFNT